MIRELDAYEVSVSEIGTARYSAPSGMHDDIVIMLVLANAAINEFSTDETMGNDSNTAIPTERAIVVLYSLNSPNVLLPRIIPSAVNVGIGAALSSKTFKLITFIRFP